MRRLGSGGRRMGACDLCLVLFENARKVFEKVGKARPDTKVA